MSPCKLYARGIIDSISYLNIIATIVCVIVSWSSAAVYHHSWSWTATDNARLLGHVIATRKPSSVVSCLTSCTQKTGCWTVNHRADDGTCEMNNADDRWNDVNISRSGPEFRYYQKVIPTGPQDVTLKELANASPCYDGHLYLNNTCLEVVPDPPVFVNWSQARSICSQKFGRLAVLDSPILESILSKLPNFGLKKNYYIDIVRRSDGVLIWGATGGVCSLQRPPWYNGQPDNYKLGSAPENCGNIEDTATSYRYLDVPCNLSRGYICQYAPWVHYVW